MSLKEYKPGAAFSGTIGRTADASEPAWPQPKRAPEGISNVLFIVLDDTGFGQLGCYGSPIHTPTFDALAQGGLRYSQMQTTALCSPSRSCILTGRNHHSNHMAGITEISTGYPGYDAYIPFENGFLSEILQLNGYNTYAVGKWHLTPAEQISAAGPYDRWPLGRGFERFYGFHSGDTHQYYPELTYDNHRAEPPKTPEEGYHLTEDLVDRAISFIADSKQVAPNKPFFLYFATGAMHAPHHVPKEWADKYRGMFDDGWDAYREKVFARQKELGVVPKNAELSRHDPDVQEWESLSADERRLYARMMEVFAGFLEHTDHHIGRLIEFLRETGELDNTLIMVISDNGASAEGGPHGSVNEAKFFNNLPESVEQNLAAIDELGGPKYYNHYPWGWTWAGNAPFRRWKRETYRGGTSDPFIVHWPKGIRAKGEVRNQFAHAIDMVPTVLEALEIEPPTHIRGVQQAPIEGISLVYSFDDGKAAARHRTQYFEMLGHRAIYHDGWRAVCPWPGPSFAEAGLPFGTPIPAERLTELDATAWELYHVAEDIAENHNVAEQHRDKLIEMIATWYTEAGKYNVLPVQAPDMSIFAAERPAIAVDRTRYTFYPGTSEIPSNSAPKLLNRSHSIHAKVAIPDGSADGVLVSQGGIDGGYAFFVKDRKLHYTYNYLAEEVFKIVADADVPPGDHILSFEFEPTGKPEPAVGKGTPGKVKLFIDGRQVGGGELPVTTPFSLGLMAAISVGRDAGSPVTTEYEAPYEFQAELRGVMIDVSGAKVEDHEEQIRMALARQ